MKSALCLSGLPRHIERGYELIYKNVIKPNECDVFVHTWIDPYDPEAASLLSKIQNLYQPKHIIFQPQIDFGTSLYDAGPYADGSNEKRVFNIQSMWYSIWAAQCAAVTHAQYTGEYYTWYARARFDWDIKDKIDFKLGHSSKLNVYNDCTHNDSCITDHFAFGSFTVMNKYSNLFNNIKRIVKESGCYFCSEILLGHWMQMVNVETQQIQLPNRPIPLH